MYRHVPILLVEDDENDRFIFKRALLRAGINCPLGMAADGKAAVEYLRGAQLFANRETFPFPNLVILDIKLPRLNGFEVLKWIRAEPGLRRMPVVMFSSSSESSDVDLAHDLGANGYGVKPPGLTGMEQFVHGIEAFWLRCHCYPRCDDPAGPTR